jgi:hypothetical protein
VAWLPPKSSVLTILAVRHAFVDFLTAAADQTAPDPGHLRADIGDRTAVGVLRPRIQIEPGRPFVETLE